MELDVQFEDLYRHGPLPGRSCEAASEVIEDYDRGGVRAGVVCA